MAGEFLLDTNIVIALFKPDPIVENHSHGKVLYLPAIVIGELYYGAAKAQRSSENIQRIQQFLTNAIVVPCDLRTAQLWGEFKARLDAKGSRIPDNDIWIAASAIQHGLTLVTRDQHFNVIEGLNIQNWS
jgi:tRNA(fMet)-specific endonuclease VapC